MIFCEHGTHKDERGCNTCVCNTETGEKTINLVQFDAFTVRLHISRSVIVPEVDVPLSAHKMLLLAKATFSRAVGQINDILSFVDKTCEDL